MSLYDFGNWRRPYACRDPDCEAGRFTSYNEWQNHRKEAH